MKNFLSNILFLSSFSVLAQNKEITGFAYSNSKELVFAKVIFFDSNNHVVCGATTDFDGFFSFKNLPQISEVKYIVCQAICSIPDTLFRFNLEDDKLKLNFSISEIECESKTYKSCPQYTDSCEIFRGSDILFFPFDRIEGDVVNELNQPIRLTIRKPSSTQNGCCKNVWYCKTHDVDF